MKNNFPKIQFLFSIIFLFIFFSIFFFFYNAIESNNVGLQLKQTDWQNENNRQNEIKTLNNSLKAIEEEKTQMETHFAQSSDAVPFLNTIEGLAPKTGVKAEVTSVDISPDNTGLLVGMKASGSFSGLYKFITMLENSPYEIKFISLDIQKEAVPDGTKGAPASVWDVVLKIKLLSFVL